MVCVQRLLNIKRIAKNGQGAPLMKTRTQKTKPQGRGPSGALKNILVVVGGLEPPTSAL
jgi:hypothetical protein